MPLWGNIDRANSSPKQAIVQLGQGYTDGNQANLFNNVQTGAWVAGANVGVFGASVTEVANTASESVAHAGWTLRTEGTGGRAGRVHHEVLVAMSSITGDAPANTDNTVFGGV
jgi:hypothetical protein